MNKKLSAIILFLLIISLISVLLAFIAFSQGGKNQDVGTLQTGYDELKKQVNELKVTTQELDTKVNSETPTQQTATNTTSPVTNPTPTTQPAATPTPAAPSTKTVVGNKVNLRVMASPSGKVVRQLSKGEKVTPTGQTFTSSGYHWIQVKDTAGKTGWLVSSFLQ